MPPRFRYTLRPDNPTVSEKHFALRGGYIPLPPAVDLTKFCGPINNQGNIGDCSGEAGSELVEWYLNAQQKPFVRLSPMFVYAWERILAGDLNQDGGARLQDDAQVLTTKGVAPLAVWPTNPSTLFSTPSEEANRKALAYRMATAYRLHGLSDVLQALAQSHVPLIGIVVYPAFESDEALRTGHVPIPQQFNQALGGHALLAVGYDLNAQWVKVQNSWGEHVGDHGFFYIPFTYLSAGLMSAWVILPEDPPPAPKEAPLEKAQVVPPELPKTPPAEKPTSPKNRKKSA